MVCTRVVIIDRGRIVAEDTPERLTGAGRGSVRFRVEVEGPPNGLAERLQNVAGVDTVALLNNDSEEARSRRTTRFIIESMPGEEAEQRRVRREVARTVVEAGVGLLELRVERPTLEEVFVRLTTTEAA